MERRRGQRECAVIGASSLAAGTAVWALCSSSTAACSTNVVVLTGGRVTTWGCAAYSTAAHVGVGAMILGAVLLMAWALLAWRTADGSGSMPGEIEGNGERPPLPAQISVTQDDLPEVAAFAATVQGANPGHGGHVGNGSAPPAPPAPAAPPPPSREPAVPVGMGDPSRRSDTPPATSPLQDLPPGWYGNPDLPGGRPQWWDGTRLVERRPDSWPY